MIQRSNVLGIARALLMCLAFSLSICAQHDTKAPPKETLRAQADPKLPDYKPAAQISGTLNSVGADTMETLMKYWIELFTKTHPGTKIEMEAKASGTAAPALTAGTSQLGPVAREMLPNEIAPFEQKYGYKPFAIRVAGGSYRTPGKTHAICFYVNKDNPIDKLSYSQLDAIFSTTHRRGHEDITTWGQLGLTGEWSDKKISLWGLIRPNGIANFVQERVLLNGEYKSGINERTTVGSLPALDAIVQGVAADRYAIGYAGFSNAIPGVKQVALAEKDNGPYFKGTFDEVVSQKYPLSRFIYIYMNRPPDKPLDPLVKEFLNMVLSKEGEEAVVREGIFLPLPAEILIKERGKLN